MPDITTMADPVARFRAVGEALYGATWQTELSRQLGHSDASQVRRMARGASRIMPHTWAAIARLIREQRDALMQALPMADPEDAGMERLRHCLRRGFTSEVSACLIGMGRWRMAEQLDAAVMEAEAAERDYAGIRRRPATDAEMAADPMLALTREVPEDADADAAAFRAMAAARGAVNALLSEVRALADSLDQGYDGAPS